MSETPSNAGGNNVIEINDVDCFGEFKLNGHQFTVDLAELQDRLWDIERQHNSDPWRCRDCGQDWLPAKDEQRYLDERGELPCPACGSTSTVPPQGFLDDVAKMLIRDYGVPRVGRNGAGQFYQAVAGKLTDLKKTNSTPAGSLFGTGESTPEIGILPESEPG